MGLKVFKHRDVARCCCCRLEERTWRSLWRMCGVWSMARSSAGGHSELPGGRHPETAVFSFSSQRLLCVSEAEIQHGVSKSHSPLFHPPAASARVSHQSEVLLFESGMLRPGKALIEYSCRWEVVVVATRGWWWRSWCGGSEETAACSGCQHRHKHAEKLREAPRGPCDEVTML
jgi:hypothetical protein